VIRSIVIATLVGATATFAAEVSFDDLMANPARYNGERVTVKGFAATGGDDFDLWRDLRARQRFDLKRRMSVLWDLREQPNGPANLRWVKVIGIVDTRYHGRVGDENFGLIKERVEVLPGPRHKELLYTLGVFRNDTSLETHVLLSILGTKPGGFYCDMQVGPHGINTSEVREGKAEVTTLSGRPLTTYKIRFSGAARHLCDSDRHAYYFRFDKDGMKMVSRSETKDWKLSFPERD
jgi:hypothetical protein